MELLTFRLYADIQFNRAINEEKDYISPGGYCMKMGNKTVSFDFEEYEGTIDSKCSNVLHIICKNPDYETFEDLSKLQKIDLKQVSGISEFFVYTGEIGETDLKPAKLLNCTFCLPDKNWKNIEIPSSVCETACLCSNI